MRNFLEKRFWVGILVVFIVGMFMRFWEITKYPVSLSMDEVAIGYNAYSILQTGHDEHGKFLPLAFESVGDYKPPVDVYLIVISEAIFSYNEFAVRAPVAFLGALAAVIFIFLLRRLKFSKPASVFGGLWLAILPWYVHLSRAGFQTISASLFFLILGTWLYLWWLEDKSLKLLIGTIVSFSLSVWAYHAERFFVPVLVIFLIILFWKEIKIKSEKVKKQLGVAIIVFLLFAVPFVNLALFTPAIVQRAESTSILREPSLARALHASYGSLNQEIFDNNLYLVFRHWAGKYMNYYDLRFLFWDGMQFTPPGYPDMGLLYLADLPIFIAGLVFLIKSENKKLKALSLFWFLAGPLSASFAMNEQHPSRVLVWLPFFGIAIAAGFEWIFLKFKKLWVVPIYFALLIINIIFFADIYIHQLPYFYADAWQYGYKQVAQIACANLDKYDKIFISDTFGTYGPLNTGTPYLYVLFYCLPDRDNFLATGQHLSKIYFRRPNASVESEKGKLLLIGSPWDFLDGNLYGGKLVNKIIYPSGIDAFWIVERK